MNPAVYGFGQCRCVSSQYISQPKQRRGRENRVNRDCWIFLHFMRRVRERARAVSEESCAKRHRLMLCTAVWREGKKFMLRLCWSLLNSRKYIQQIFHSTPRLFSLSRASESSFFLTHSTTRKKNSSVSSLPDFPHRLFAAQLPTLLLPRRMKGKKSREDFSTAIFHLVPRKAAREGGRAMEVARWWGHAMMTLVYTDVDGGELEWTIVKQFFNCDLFPASL